MDEKAQSVLQDVQDKNVNFIDLQFTDVIGRTKSVTIPAKHLDEALNRGIWFDGSSIQGFARIQESDMFLRPDVRSYRVLPWTGGDVPLRARLICDVHKPDGTPFEGDPRYILKKAIAEAEEMGFEYNTGPELEFFLFKKKKSCSRLYCSFFPLPCSISKSMYHQLLLICVVIGTESCSTYHGIYKLTHFGGLVAWFL